MLDRAGEQGSVGRRDKRGVLQPAALVKAAFACSSWLPGDIPPRLPVRQLPVYPARILSVAWVPDQKG